MNRDEIRNLFAAAALTGLLASETEEWAPYSSGKTHPYKAVAEAAFDIAESMLDASDFAVESDRERKKEEKNERRRIRTARKNPGA